MKIKGHAKEYYLKINNTIKNPNFIKNFNLSLLLLIIILISEIIQYKIIYIHL